MNSLPLQLIDSLLELPGFIKEDFLQAHQTGRSLTSIRLNPLKPTKAIEQLPIDSSVPWCHFGKYLAIRPSFTLDPIFHGGAYYVQEASSMFLHHVVNELFINGDYPERVLDLCAAPGGKTTLLSAVLPDSLVVANEVIKSRVPILSENVTKWGSGNVVVVNNDPKDFSPLSGYFQLMVVDAPCSGSGLFRKDNDAINEWSESQVQMCSMRQQRILQDAIGCLQQNGFLIYSTCSYSIQENEEICDWIAEKLKLTPVAIDIDSAWGIVQSVSPRYKIPSYRFYPNKVKGEGFFLACFKQDNAVHEYADVDLRLKELDKSKKPIAQQFLNNADEYILNDEKELVIAFKRKWEKDYATLWKLLNVRKAGVAIGTIKGKDFIPHHEIALSQSLNKEASILTLNKNQALQYLRRQNIDDIDISQKGWSICRYEDINLGWVKVLPNRVNNYYPTDWRIVKT